MIRLNKKIFSIDKQWTIILVLISGIKTDYYIRVSILHFANRSLTNPTKCSLECNYVILIINQTFNYGFA